jgi:hypothetical protein
MALVLAGACSWGEYRVMFFRSKNGWDNAEPAPIPAPRPAASPVQAAANGVATSAPQNRS